MEICSQVAGGAGWDLRHLLRSSSSQHLVEIGKHVQVGSRNGELFDVHVAITDTDLMERGAASLGEIIEIEC